MAPVCIRRTFNAHIAYDLYPPSLELNLLEPLLSNNKIDLGMRRLAAQVARGANLRSVPIHTAVVFASSLFACPTPVLAVSVERAKIIKKTEKQKLKAQKLKRKLKVEKNRARNAEERETNELENERQHLLGDNDDATLDDLAHSASSIAAATSTTASVPMKAVLQAVRKLGGAADADGGTRPPPNIDDALSHETLAVLDTPSADVDHTGGPLARELRLRCPEIAAQYDPKNSQPLETVMYDSAKLVKWRCGICKHKWTASVIVRSIYGTPCPKCAESDDPALGTAAPGLVREWDSTRNDPFVNPATISARSLVRAKWLCSACKSPFEARVRDRVTGKVKCETCALLGYRTDPDREEQLRREWHPLRNGDLLREHIKVSDHKKVWWLCQTCGREWEAMLATRLRRVDNTAGRGSDCPYCAQAKKAIDAVEASS